MVKASGDELAKAEAFVQVKRAAAKSAEDAWKIEHLAAAARFLPQLPIELKLLIMLMLPVDSRLRCREVCKAWCMFLDTQHTLWKVRFDAPRLWRSALACVRVLEVGVGESVGRAVPAIV